MGVPVSKMSVVMNTPSLERGQEYSELLPTISLFILDFVELPTRGYHSEFRLLDIHEHHTFSQDLVLHVLELPKVPAVSRAVCSPRAFAPASTASVKRDRSRGSPPEAVTPPPAARR